MRALESQVIQQQNDQPPRVKIHGYQNGQDARKGQTPGALINEEEMWEKKRMLVAGSELDVNSDETGPSMKRTRFSGA